MKKNIRKKAALIIASLVTVMMSTVSVEAAEKMTASNTVEPKVVQQFIEEAKKNTNWKTAFVTGEQEQIVFMNVSPSTNPNNEIGLEVHPFDQIIFIVEGNGKAVLNEKTSLIKDGDMIFIPRGTAHNFINSGKEKGLKLISFYSENDIPKEAVYKKKADEPKE